MKIRTIDCGRLPHFRNLTVGVNTIAVGNFSHYVKPGDGLIFYRSVDDCVTCNFEFVGLVISVDTEIGAIVLDCRIVDLAFHPDRHALGRWRSNPHLPPDKHKVVKYGFRELFAEAFQDESLATAKLEDSVGNVFRPDLSIPTLTPVAGFVYLFRRPDLLKIGKTTDLVRRQRELEREHRVSLELLHSFKSADYTRAEGMLLAQYRPKLREGAEWFDLDENDVEHICSIEDFALDQ